MTLDPTVYLLVRAADAGDCFGVEAADRGAFLALPAGVFGGDIADLLVFALVRSGVDGAVPDGLTTTLSGGTNEPCLAAH